MQGYSINDNGIIFHEDNVIVFQATLQDIAMNPQLGLQAMRILDGYIQHLIHNKVEVIKCCKNEDIRVFGPNESLSTPITMCVNCGKIIREMDKNTTLIEKESTVVGNESDLDE